MSLGKKKILSQGASAPAPTPFDPLENFETVTYTGNGGTQKITGYIRKGAAFNGLQTSSASYIDIPSSTTSTTTSVSLWFNTTVKDSNQGNILDAGGGSSGNTGFAIVRKPTTGYLQVNFTDGTTGQTQSFTGSTDIADGNWHNVVLSMAADNTFVFYLDGSSHLSGTRTRFTSGDTQNKTVNRFGTNAGSIGASSYGGKIDQVRIFNKALSASEVTTLYGETSASSTKSTTDIFSDGSGVALYELDEDANDTGVSIDSGQSGVFNGSSSTITSNLTSGLTGSFSVSAWFVQNNISTDTAHRELISYMDSDGSTGWWIGKHNNTTQWRILGAAGVSLVTMTAQSGWNHLAIIKDASTIYIYLNGSQVTSFAFPGYWNLGTGNTPKFNIGTQYPGNNEYWDGKIDQVRIYSSALSSGDISNLYNETSVPTANLVSWYKLDGNANDSQGSNNGTATSVTYSTPALRQHNGTATNVNYLGMAFQPDMIWIKTRNQANDHNLVDSIRGTTKYLRPNRDIAEVTQSDGVTSLNTNGFTVGSGGDFGGSNNEYVAWAFKGGGAPTATNSAGAGNVPTAGSVKIDGADLSTALAGATPATNISANTGAGFSIVKYTGPASNSTIGHGLGVTPSMIIQKPTGSGNWYVYFAPGVIDATSTYYYMVLNSNASKGTTGSAAPTTTTFNAAGSGAHIAYCFADVAGYQKVGSYTGNGGTLSVTTGFAPRFVMLKPSSLSDNWLIYDSTRGNNLALFPNLANGDTTYTGRFSFLSDGFQLSTSNSGWNGSGSTYIYLAIA